MPTDIKYTDDYETALTDRNDLARVTDGAYRSQRATTRATAVAEQFRGGAHTDQRQQDLTERIETAIENDDQLADTVSARVIAARGNQLSVVVTVGEDTIAVSLS